MTMQVFPATAGRPGHVSSKRCPACGGKLGSVEGSAMGRLYHVTDDESSFYFDRPRPMPGLLIPDDCSEPWDLNIHFNGAAGVDHDLDYEPPLDIP